LIFRGEPGLAARSFFPEPFIPDLPRSPRPRYDQNDPVD